MTVYTFLKASLIIVILIGLTNTGFGLWKMWSAYDFSRNAIVKQGVFRGYHEHRFKSSTLDTSGTKSYRTVVEYLPMFSYVNSGIRYEITGQDGHFFKHLKHKVNNPVKVLVSPDDPKRARLGDFLSLYCNGMLLGMGSLIFIILPWYGIKYINSWRDTALEAATTAGRISQHIGQSHIPISSIVIILGGFFLIAGSMAAYVYYSSTKRNNDFLIQAIESGDYENALILALQGRGIDGKNSKNETALITALKANQPDVACAIIDHLWVSRNCSDAQGNLAIQIAAFNGDQKTLSLLLEKGEPIYHIRPKEIYHLIRKGDAATIKFVVNHGFNIKEDHSNLTYGDLAVLEGQADVVKLIKSLGGTIKAPPAFVAMALDDPVALRKALEFPNASSQKFRGLTLEKFAKKIGKMKLLE
ncbi:MAG: ankyrin repeat domain-containing protein [Desulfobacteraceae bacterium]|jgi:hypothetical protein